MVTPLVVCIALAVILLIAAVVFWIRGRRGRALRALALAAGVAGIYLTGLLDLVVNGIRALIAWGSALVLNPTVWAGIGLLGLMVVLWIVGGYLIQRRAYRLGREGDRPATTGRTTGRPADQLASGRTRTDQAPTATGKPAQPAQQDDEMAEIEALLKKRGIE